MTFFRLPQYLNKLKIFEQKYAQVSLADGIEDRNPFVISCRV